MYVYNLFYDTRAALIVYRLLATMRLPYGWLELKSTYEISTSVRILVV